MKITFIGGGNMACALISGLLKQGYAADQICVIEINDESRIRISERFGVLTAADLANGITPCPSDRAGGADNVIVLSVKPQQLHAVAQQLKGMLDQHLVISIAAGIRTTDIMRWLDGYRRVIRTMPNTPSLVGAGVTGLYASSNASAQDRQAAELIMQAVGAVLWVEDEEMLHAVTAISGSGPAYVFYFIESLQQAGMELGLTANEARQLTLQTFCGAVKLANESSEDAAVLRARVTSTGGTTQQAIQSMDMNEVKSKIIAAINAANVRSREMSDEFSKL
ncbi:pyrroline-5-carboxylate reductase [Nitrosomonas aestuarii]|uniref:pyrroline-5-carboxylate reductase n=1 Tax=Nitrosomonas aestuarii TaxID=52441 RepID=UPI000D307B6A|nr:pyrroline-5-carboxylate reductase [Nitrosomonas aestuarii]PTN10786.1 pyrroline-5-carboxylate reductase [Nitrosomonas aestuarii]